MSSSKEMGKISQKLYHEIEWTIEDIFSYTVEDERYQSPTVSVPGSEWYLRIYPNGETKHNSVGWIGLYVCRITDFSTPPKSVTYDLGVKNDDGDVEVLEKGVQDNGFKGKTSAYGGTPKFLQRSDLKTRTCELAPTGALTVTCTVRVKDAFDCTSRLIELSDNFKNMLLSAKGCDATLKVQDREFPVHKSVLASRSSVFEAMFEVDMREKNTGTVDIVDCQPDVFNDFLVYMYSGQFQISSGDVFELYKIAHKYCTEGLKSPCVHFIASSLSVDNFVDVAVLGDQFDEDELRSKSQDFFNKNFDIVFPTNKWITLLKNKPTLANGLLINMGKYTKMKEKRGW